MATHASILTWRIPWTEEPDGLQSRGRRESDITEYIITMIQTLNNSLPEFIINRKGEASQKKIYQKGAFFT